MNIRRNCQGIKQLLENIHISYNECLGAKSIYFLKCYLDGFARVVQFHEETKSDLFQNSLAEERTKTYDEFAMINDFFLDFQKWIEDKYSCKLSQSWYNIIYFYTNSEEEAFELFYYELEQFYKINYRKDDMRKNNYNVSYYGKIDVIGDDIEYTQFNKEQYNNEFYWKLWKILIMIKKAPILILGEKSLSLVRVYLNGFIKAYNTIYASNLYIFFPGFEEWINKKVGVSAYRPWHKVILFISTSEEDAFDMFFCYLEEFIG